MKTGQSRIDDAVAYVYLNVNQELANHLSMTVRAGNVNVIGKELSLGSRADGTDDPAYAANTRKRNALRALLLCQRVYFSELWWTDTYSDGSTAKASKLFSGWKTTSLQHWGTLSETQIAEGIRIFATTTRDHAALVTAANAQPAAATLPNLTVTRGTQPFPGLLSCYGAVMTWMVRSGIASLRWYGKYAGANTQATLTNVFGTGTQLIGPDTPFGTNSNFPSVPAGHIVHMFCDGVRWNGHWLVSLGNGFASGCNNDSTDGTNTSYTASCSLANQFRNGYREALPDGQGHWKGQAVVVDPLGIPDLF